MIKKLKKKSEFSRNVVTLMTGTAIAQAIPIAISPILTRLYAPEDFGVFALFISISSIAGSIINGRYELAIMLPKKDEDAINIFVLGFIITVFISLFLFFIIIIFHDNLVELLGNKGIGVWLYFVPLSIFFTGLYNILNYFYIRKKYYKDIASATIMKSITTAVVQISIGFLKSGDSGLVSGQLTSQIVANVKLFKNITKEKELMQKISKIKIIALAKRYKNFPKFSMPAVLANSLSYHLTNILISSFYAISTLGFYSLSQKLLGMPSSFIGNSIGQVYFQQATIEKQETGSSIETFRSTLRKLFLISFPFFLILYFIVEDLFAFVFGEEWRVAGVYAKLLIPFFCISFVSSPLAITLTIYERQKSSFVINIILIISSVGVILLCHYMNTNFEKFLEIFSIIMSINYLSFIFYYIKIAKGE